MSAPEGLAAPDAPELEATGGIEPCGCSWPEGDDEPTPCARHAAGP